jgi:phage shock protein A
MRLFTFSAVVLGVVALAAGPRLLMSHIRGVRDQAVKAIQDSLPDDHVVAQAEDELKQFDARVREYHLKVAGIGDQLAAARAKAEKTRKDLDGERKILGRIRESLDSADDRFEIGGRSYTRGDLDRDGQIRLARCASLEDQLRSQQKLEAELSKAHDEGRKWLAEAEQTRTRRAGELEALKVRLANARARGELTRIDLSPLTASDSGRQLAVLDERVKSLEIGNDYDAAKTRGVVDWTPAAGDTRDAIGKYLAPGATSAVGSK